MGMCFLFTWHWRIHTPLKYLKWTVFAKIDFLKLAIFAKCSMLDVWQGSEYATGSHIGTWQIEQMCVIKKTKCFHSLIWNQTKTK